VAATCGMSVRNNTREHQAGVEDFAGRKKRNKTKNRRARRESKQELEKLINAAIEEWIWSQRGQKRESEEKAIKADSGKRKGRAEAVRSGRMRDSTGRKAK